MNIRMAELVRSHGETMAIMNEMVEKGQLDGAIVADMDRELAAYPIGQMPNPPGAALQ